MTREEFDALVLRLEQQARGRPRGYVARVLLLALLGNAYIFAILLLIVALLAALAASLLVLKWLAVKLIMVLGVFLWIVVKAVWIGISPPDGDEIDRQDAPELFAMIDELQQSLGAPRFHKVLVDNRFNAGVVQVPRLGVFGWHENYLLIGLPLMKGLTETQFKAVLAHEFGHLAQGHGRVSNWIYRQRLRWSRLIAALEQTESKGGFLFKSFLNWYGPYFNAYSFPLARANEYQADATAARLTSPKAIAQALTGVDVIGDYFNERYWSQIYRQADEMPQPSFSPYAGMATGVASELDDVATQAWLQRALARSTTSDDTHPALTERLKAIGESPHLAQPQPEQAADRLLGPSRAHITESFDRLWRTNIQPSWTARHREVQEGRRLLADLDAKHDSGAELSMEQAVDRALFTEKYGNDRDKAFEQFGELHRRHPDEVAICFALGFRMLERDDDAGIALLQFAMDRDEHYLRHGAEALRDYHWRHGRKEQAHAFHERAVERANVEQIAQRERNEIRESDKFDPHGLADDALAALRAQLQSVDGLRKAWLVRRRPRHPSDPPCYLLGFTASGWFSLNGERRRSAVMEQIRTKVTFPGETLVLCVEGRSKPFARRFQRVDEKRIV